MKKIVIRKFGRDDSFDPDGEINKAMREEVDNYIKQQNKEWAVFALRKFMRELEQIPPFSYALLAMCGGYSDGLAEKVFYQGIERALDQTRAELDYIRSTNTAESKLKEPR